MTEPMLFCLDPEGTVVPVPIEDFTPVSGAQIPDLGVHRLDDLDDVSGADSGITGQVLTKTADGQWRPLTPTGDGGSGPGGPLSYTHVQDSPSTVWLITHGLPFIPSGIEVFDHTGARHFPELSYPQTGEVRLDFLYSVRGTARLS